MTDRVLNPREVSEILRVNYETVLDYIHTGQLSGVKRGSRFFIRQSAVDRFLDPAVPDTRTA